MTDLIKIREYNALRQDYPELFMSPEKTNGRIAISMKSLYIKLDVKKDYSSWCKRIMSYGFVDGVDFTPVWVESTGGRPGIDYALTLDCAKEICMLQRSKEGKEWRRYFINVEKKFNAMIMGDEPKEVQKAPANVLDWLQESLNVMKTHTEQIEGLKQELKALDARTTTRQEYYTIAGYASIKRLRIGINAAKVLGIKAANICRREGWLIDDVPDPRFGRVGSYPVEALEKIFVEFA